MRNRGILGLNVERTARKLGISDKRLTAIRAKVGSYEAGAGPLPEDVRLAVTLIMLHRFSNCAYKYPGLFETDEAHGAAVLWT